MLDLNAELPTNNSSASSNGKDKPTHEVVIKVPTKDGRIVTLGKIGLFANSKLHKKIIEQKDMSKILSLISKGEVEVVTAGADTSSDVELEW